MVGRLDGLLVVSIEQAVAAPYCTSRLADAGARVLKIERQEGDFARRYDNIFDGESSWFVWLNRGKESVVLDFKKKEDAALLSRIIRKADIFIQNLSPGATDRAGFGSSKLRASNPRLITCDISGYVTSGPYRDVRAYDFLVQCESGVASVTGSIDSPARVGVSVCDLTAGLNAYGAILEALIGRGTSGQGEGIQISLFDGMADWMNVARFHQLKHGSSPARMGLSHSLIAPYGVYIVGDGKEIVIAIQNDREWQRFASNVLLDSSLGTDIRFDNNASRVENRKSMDEIIVKVFSRYKLEALCELLTNENIAFGRLNNAKQLASHPHLRKTQVQLPNGDMIDLISPPSQFNSEKSVLGSVPSLGQHTDSIKQEVFSDKGDVLERI